MGKQSKASKQATTSSGSKPIKKAPKQPQKGQEKEQIVVKQTIQRSNVAQFFEQQAQHSGDGSVGQSGQDGEQVSNFIDDGQIEEQPNRAVYNMDLESNDNGDDQDLSLKKWGQLSNQQQIKFGQSIVFQAWKVVQKQNRNDASPQLICYILSGGKRDGKHPFYSILKKKWKNVVDLFSTNGLYNQIQQNLPFSLYSYAKVMGQDDFSFQIQAEDVKKLLWRLFFFQSCQYEGDNVVLDPQVLGSLYETFLEAANTYNFAYIERKQQQVAHSCVGFSKVKFALNKSTPCNNCLDKKKGIPTTIKTLCSSCSHTYKQFIQQISCLIINGVYVKKPNKNITGGYKFPYLQVLHAKKEQIIFTDYKTQQKTEFIPLVEIWFKKIKEFILQANSGYRLAQIWKFASQYMIRPNLTVKQCGYYGLLSSSNFNGQFNSQINFGIDSLMFVIQGGTHTAPIDFWTRQYSKGQVVPFFMSSKGLLISPAFTPLNQWTKQLFNYQVTQQMMTAQIITQKNKQTPDEKRLLTSVRLTQSISGMNRLPSDEVFKFMIKECMAEIMAYSLGANWTLAPPVRKELAAKTISKSEADISPITIIKR